MTVQQLPLLHTAHVAERRKPQQRNEEGEAGEARAQQRLPAADVKMLGVLGFDVKRFWF